MLAGNLCWAEIPHLINYQGMLTDDQGQPHSGNYKLKFSIYAVPTGGTALWSELHLGIPVQDGLFNALLGMNKPIPDSVFDEPERFLGIKVGTYPELSPRIQLTSAGYAYRASKADFAQEAETDNDWTISGNNMYSAVSGSVGIGTEDPAEKLDVDGNLKVRGSVFEVLGGAGSYVKVGSPDAGYSTTFSYQSDGSMFDTYISNPCGLGIGCDLILDFPFGNVGIGTSSPTQKLDVNGTARLRGISGTTEELTHVVVDANGVLYKWLSPSSIRYKKNIRGIEIDPEDILKLQTVRFEWKKSGKEDVGLIAEDVEKAVPDLVIYDDQGRPNGVRYNKLALYLLETVKQLKAENDALKNRIETLESKE